VPGGPVRGGTAPPSGRSSSRVTRSLPPTSTRRCRSSRRTTRTPTSRATAWSSRSPVQRAPRTSRDRSLKLYADDDVVNPSHGQGGEHKWKQQYTYNPPNTLTDGQYTIRLQIYDSTRTRRRRLRLHAVDGELPGRQRPRRASSNSSAATLLRPASRAVARAAALGARAVEIAALTDALRATTQSDHDSVVTPKWPLECWNCYVQWCHAAWGQRPASPYLVTATWAAASQS
jgi:hypothetical protein